MIKHRVDVADQPGPWRGSCGAQRRPKSFFGPPYARIEEEYIAGMNGKPVHLALELLRHEYADMVAPFIEEAPEAAPWRAATASLTASQVDEILLVGGATRTPLVHRRLAEAFGKEARGEVDPDLCVAMGAAVQEASVAGAEVSAVLVDITPYTFGTSAVGDMEGKFYPFGYAPIIKNPIPVCKSEVFYTMRDNQHVVEVKIFQGEKLDAFKNIELGEFRVEGLDRVAAGNPIIVDLKRDRDGILHVAAREKNSGRERYYHRRRRATL